eukprot:GHVR01086638.1.p1 GENE.GHVR01086638.1~~GHVR01086638.1.p1  ORF type:complete len:214 (-),score=54.76 GHVR01086638.1:50-691(-)
MYINNITPDINKRRLKRDISMIESNTSISSQSLLYNNNNNIYINGVYQNNQIKRIKHTNKIAHLRLKKELKVDCLLPHCCTGLYLDQSAATFDIHPTSGCLTGMDVSLRMVFPSGYPHEPPTVILIMWSNLSLLQKECSPCVSPTSSVCVSPVSSACVSPMSIPSVCSYDPTRVNLECLSKDMWTPVMGVKLILDYLLKHIEVIVCMCVCVFM